MPAGSRQDADIELPAAFHTVDGRPRFVMPIPRRALKDAGIGFLFRHERQFFGYEYPTRRFLDEHLAPGDLFIDIGAHWGLFSLTAATRWTGDAEAPVTVLAIEPEPDNLVQLRRWIAFNGLERAIRVIPAAAGARPERAAFRRDSSMGHRVIASGQDLASVPGSDFEADVVTVDSLVAESPELQHRRTFIKADVEGFEAQALGGAGELLQSGNVAAVIWERGRSYDRDPERRKFNELCRWLSNLGFEHFRFPHENLGGPLIPFVLTHELCNIVSLRPGFWRKADYARPPGPIPPSLRPTSTALAEPARRHLTAQFMAAGATDGGRWADPANLKAGADRRAGLAARHIGHDRRVLDIGCGLMRLHGRLHSSVGYRPVDLIRRSADCLVLDLNDGRFPAEAADDAVFLEVLEFVHDVPGVLARARATATRLLFTYHLATGESSTRRRAAGWFNDLTDDQLNTALAGAGWKIVGTDAEGPYRLFVCDRTD